MKIKNLLKSSESGTLIFKEKFDDRIVESAVAFANAKGGMIIIGVPDKGTVTGIDLDLSKMDKLGLRQNRATAFP